MNQVLKDVEQLHRIFKLCGPPSEDYWRKLKLLTNFRPPQTYKSTILETCRELPASSFGLLMTLLALDPSSRGTAASALQNEFFSTSPLACDLSGLPVIYQEENDDSTQPCDRRKRKTSKLKQRSQSHRENMIKLEHDAGVQKADSSSSKEDMKSVEQGSSTASTSSSMKTESFTLISPQSQPPFTSSLSKQSPRTTFHPSAAKNIVNLPSSPSISKRSPRTEYHPSSAKNIVNPLPPRPPSKILAADRNTQGLDVMHPRYGLEKRPASMSDVGRAAREQLLNNYGPDD